MPLLSTKIAVTVMIFTIIAVTTNASHWRSAYTFNPILPISLTSSDQSDTENNTDFPSVTEGTYLMIR